MIFGSVTAVLLAILVTGFSRLSIDADLFSMLPTDSREVDALRLYQQAFAGAQELMISVRAEDPLDAEQAAEELAEDLINDGLAAWVLWRPPEFTTAERAEMVAFLWLNQSSEQFVELSEQFSPERMEATLEDSLQRLATSLEPIELAQLSRDPYRLTEVAQEHEWFGQDGGNQFSSSDGRFRVLLVGAPETVEHGFGQALEWVQSTAEYLDDWPASGNGERRVELKLTGNPAFVAESGGGLVREVQWAALITVALIGALFWAAHRSWLPLLRLLMLLGLVLALATAIGSLIFGRLNVVSLGFAAILLGIAADYGMIVHQEVVSNPRRVLKDHVRLLVPGILWAALTTASAFLILSRSSLPGLSQLGVLVAVGVLTAAVVMLFGFLVSEADQGIKQPSSTRTHLATFDPQSSGFWIVTLGLVIVSVMVLAIEGLPTLERGTQELDTPGHAAQAALEEVEREIGTREADYWLIVPGDDEQQVADRLDRVATILNTEYAGSLFDDHRLPQGLWPNPALQQANREVAADLAVRKTRAIDTALAAGFTAEALALTEQVFEAWTDMAVREGVIWPRGENIEPITRRFMARDDNNAYLVLGLLDSSPEASEAEIVQLANRIDEETGAWLAGWPLLSDALLAAMERDFKRVLLPLVFALMLLLGIAFRNLREVALSLATLGLGLVSLMAVMALAGWSWNLMNLLGLGLLLGLGVDYSVHIQFALRRCNGDIKRVSATTGRALVLCGVSTASGFGSLAFVSNAGLASLGRICGVGILLMCFVAVFLLPAWWKKFEA
ncbi:MAG: MMPL family transporter [Wenzhouxiangella sp.]